jgi:hypothetical protein
MDRTTTIRQADTPAETSGNTRMVALAVLDGLYCRLFKASPINELDVPPEARKELLEQRATQVKEEIDRRYCEHYKAKPLNELVLTQEARNDVFRKRVKEVSDLMAMSTPQDKSQDGIEQ